MALRLYDKAIIDKLQKWTNKTDVTILGPEDFQRRINIIADNTEDKPITFPLIALSRDSGYTIELPTRHPMSFDGYTREYSDTVMQQFNAIPIVINYELNVYTRYAEEADEYIRQLVFNFINFPKLKIYIPYQNCNVWYESSIWIDSEVTRAESVFPGQYTGYRFALQIKDAKLWDVRNRQIVTIDKNALIIESDKNDEVSEDL